MRCVILFVLGLLFGACHPPVAVMPFDHVDGASTLRARTVGLVQPDILEGDLRPYCSGVWVSNTSILTAKHCVADLKLGEPVLYVVADSVTKARGAVLYATADDHDLALLRAEHPPVDHAFARLRETPIEQGTLAQVMGHSLGLWYSYSTGDIAAVRELDFGSGPALWVQTTSPVSPGNSGGGLFDSDGRLMGVCHGSFTRGQSLNLFVHPMYITALFAEVRQAGML